MTTIARESATDPITERRRMRFSPEEFWILHEQGMLPERCELVDGEIFEMPAQYLPTVVPIQRCLDALRPAWHDRDLVTSAVTHCFASGWNPIPDVTVYESFPPRRPGPGVTFPLPRLVVEVADETLDYDLGEKARHYAAEGVTEMWVADVNARRLHVHREPVGDNWRVRLLFAVGDEVSPLCLPEARLAVADLLPALYGTG